MEFLKTTEESSAYQHLDKMSVKQILFNINNEDKLVPQAIEKALPSIELAVETIVAKMQLGGRIFYIGAGTSGRLGVLDASECTTTFGVPNNMIIGIIAGGDTALKNAIENAEDDTLQGWIDLQTYQVCPKDVVIGITASGTTPYVLGALKTCVNNNITTIGICCNQHAPLSSIVDFSVELIVGPEFITGSTRLKCGTAQKLVLNMISTTCMIQLGRVEGNSMVNMQLTNKKLIDRGTKIIMQQLSLTNYNEAKNLLLKHGNVKKAILSNQS